MAALDKKYLVPVSSLVSPEHQGWLTKLGEKVKNWKRRYFVLRAGVLYYYKKNDAPKPQGVIILKKGVKAFKYDHKKSPHTFAIGTDSRTYYMYGETSAETDGWLAAIKAALDGADAPVPTAKVPLSPKGSTGTPVSAIVPAAAAVQPTLGGSVGSQRGVFDTGKVPSHLMLLIFRYLDAQSLRVVNRVSKRFHQLARESDMLARRLVQRKTESAAVTLPAEARPRFQACKAAVKWLVTSPQVSEFWDIFTATVPAPGTRETASSPSTGVISFNVSSSLDLQKTTWRAEGPQHLFITPMVDFFVRVGAPDGEIDKLNQFGALITPPQIGFWIDVSQKGGLDGGWYFPFPHMSLEAILGAVERGRCTQEISAWAKKHWGERQVLCYYFGRDMGMEPPRQTELRLELPTHLSFQGQLKAAFDAYERFGFPKPPQELVDMLRCSYFHTLAGGQPLPLRLCITISSDDRFVKLALLQERPPKEMVLNVISKRNLSPEQYTTFAKLEAVLGANPRWLEYQFLKEDFSYNVYPEGFSVMANYPVGDEQCFA